MGEVINKGKNKGHDNLIPCKPGETANPNGRPKGQRNYATIYKEALRKIAESQDMTPEQIEEKINEVGLLKAMKGDYAFYRDLQDRLHGKPENKNINLNLNKDMDKLPEEDKERLNRLLNE